MASTRSRLARKQEARNLKRALLFVFLTVILGLAMIFLGIPLLIRLAVFVGNLRGSAAPIESQDTLAPTAPRFEALFEATPSSQIDLKGFTEAGAMVTVFQDGDQQEEVVAESDGSFLISNFNLDEGENEIYAVAKDEAGNESQPSKTLRITFDQTPPELTIAEPAGSTLITNEEKIEISGSLNEPGRVTINDHLVIVGPENTFRYPLALQEGDNKIIVVAQDKAGNQTEQELTITRE